MTFVKPPHPASLEPAILVKQCEFRFGRGSGPGGQHRNKVSTEVTITHLPTELQAFAGERRVQAQNRSEAIKRLRRKLAIEVRTNVDPKRYRPSELWQSRRQGKQISVNPRHRDYPTLLAEALDVVVARQFDVAGSAGILGISMSQLAKLIRHEKSAFARVNKWREAQGLPRLK